jgi:hypothetical protein
VEEMKRKEKETERDIEMDSMKEIIMKYLLSEKSPDRDNYNLSNVAEKIDELVLRKISQIVRAESASLIVPVYSSFVS